MLLSCLLRLASCDLRKGRSINVAWLCKDSNLLAFAQLGIKEWKRMETTVMGYVGTTRRIHSFIPSYPKASLSVPRHVLLTQDGEDPSLAKTPARSRSPRRELKEPK